jgi:4-amino-4-deoxy-L-arabinose transferase-like glycosyltransferase
MHRNQWGFDFHTDVWAVIPAFGDWIFSFVYMLGGETAARLVNVFFVFVLCWVIRNIVLWAGGSNNAAKWSCIIFLSSPLVFAEGNSLFIDSIWTAFTVSGILSALRMLDKKENNGGEIIISGIFFGAAIATTVLTFVFVLPLILILLINFKYWFNLKNVRAILVGFTLLLFIGGGAYLYAWVVTENPVFPFYNKLFESPYFAIENFIDSRWNKGLTWDFLYKATFKSGDYLEAMPGAAGFQWLLVFLPVLLYLVFSLHRRGVLLCVISLLSIALCFSSTTYLRYIFPAFVVLTAVCGVGITLIERSGKFQAILLTLTGIVTVSLNLVFLSSCFGVYQDFPIQSLLHRKPRSSSHVRNRNRDSAPIHNIC